MWWRYISSYMYIFILFCSVNLTSNALKIASNKLRNEKNTLKPQDHRRWVNALKICVAVCRRGTANTYFPLLWFCFSSSSFRWSGWEFKHNVKLSFRIIDCASCHNIYLNILQHNSYLKIFADVGVILQKFLRVRFVSTVDHMLVEITFES